MLLVPTPQVQALMFHQGQAIGKSLATKGTLVGLATTVGALMLVKVQCGAEAAPTVGANVSTGDVGSSVGTMSALVSVEVGAAAEALAALVAGVGLLTGVDPQVAGKVRTPGEALATVATLEGQATCVKPLVSH